MFSSFQAGLDKMAKGHMLADVVAIIGEKVFVVQEFKTLVDDVYLKIQIEAFV